MKRRLIGIALVGTTALTIVSPTFAQQAQRADVDTDTIVVTARRSEERLQDVPISITVFSQEQLSNRNVVTGTDLATYTPSLTVNNRFGSDNATFALRGFVQEIGTAPSVGVYFADVVSPRGGATGFPSGDGAGPGSFFDLQNVQILKGPQGTLFGRNTTGGAILLVPQKPTDRLEGFVEGSVGNYDMRRIQGVVNVPLADTLRIRLGVDRQTRDGTIRNLAPVGPRRISDVDYVAVRASIVADLTPDLENYTILSYSQSDTKGSVSAISYCNPAIAPFNPLDQSTIAPNFFVPSACENLAEQRKAGFYSAFSAVRKPQSKVEVWQAINTTTWQATDNLTVKNIVSYARQKQFLRASVFGIYATVHPNLAASYAVYPNAQFTFSEINPIPGRPVSNQSTFTEELQFQGRSTDGSLTWQAGGYMELSNPIGLFGNQTAGSINCTDVDNFQCTDVLAPSVFGFPVGVVNYTTGRTKFRNYGLYAQSTYSLSDQIKITGGIRYTWDKVRTDSQLIVNNIIGGSPIPRCLLASTSLPECRLEAQNSSGKPTWLLGLDYTPTQNLLAYAKYTRGYRAGGIKTDAPIEYLTFAPEKVDSYEIGLKATIPGQIRGNLNIAGFYNDFQNQQLQFGFTPRPGTGLVPTAGPINAGKSRIYGFEVEANVSPLEGLRLEANYAYLKTEIKSIVQPTLPATSPYSVSGFIAPGDELLLSPKHKLVLGANYTLPLDDSIGSISFGANYIYTSKQLSNYIDRLFAPATGGVDIGTLRPTNIVNLNASWTSVAGAPVDISFFMTNLTKQKYYTFVNGVITATGFESANLGEPRTYGVRLKYRFGQ